MGDYYNNLGEDGSDHTTSCRVGGKLLHSDDRLRINPVGFRGGVLKKKIEGVKMMCRSGTQIILR